MATIEEFDELATKVSNWGRWGAQDQRGPLNLVTPEVVRKGAAAVQTGEAFSLAMNLSLDGPQNGVGVPGRINPVRTMLAVNAPMGDGPHSVCFSDDIVVTPTQTATHWDALSHVSHRGLMYNGIAADTIDAFGAWKLGIEEAGLVVSRGILLDVAGYQGVGRLPLGFAITSEVLRQVEDAQGVPVEAGGHPPDPDRAGRVLPERRCPRVPHAPGACPGLGRAAVLPRARSRRGRAGQHVLRDAAVQRP